MTVAELIQKLNLEPFAVSDGERTVSGGYAGDLLSWVMAKGRNLALVQKGSKLAGRVWPGDVIGPIPIPGPAAGWTDARDLPKPPTQTFRDWWTKEHQQPEQTGESAS